MGKVFRLFCSWLLLTAAAAEAQHSGASRLSQRALPQWLTGLISVAVFLFLTFVVLLVKKAWCQEPGRHTSPEEAEKQNEFMTSNGSVCETNLDVVRSGEDPHAYENLAIDTSDDKVTAM